MAILAHNFNLPFNILRCAYIELGVRDLEASRQFYTDTLGLILTEQTDDILYARALEERWHHSLVLRKSSQAEVYALGFKVSSEADLDALHSHFAALKLPATWVTKHAQGRTLQAKTPQGIPLEFYYNMDAAERMLQQYGAYRGCAPQRFDHFNCFANDLQATYEFLVQQLGFRLTEYTETDEGDLWACWMHRKGGVHDIALTNGSGPRLHHLAYYVSTAMDIIRLLDVMSTTGYLANIERGPGRHGISNAFFLYLRDPDGHRVEIYTSDYLTVDTDLEPIRWDLNDPQRQTLWGAAAPKSWFHEGTPFANVAVKKPKLKAKPILTGLSY